MKPEISYIGARLLSMGYSKKEVIGMVPKIEELCMNNKIVCGDDLLEEMLSVMGVKS